MQNLKFISIRILEKLTTTPSANGIPVVYKICISCSIYTLGFGLVLEQSMMYVVSLLVRILVGVYMYTKHVGNVANGGPFFVWCISWKLLANTKLTCAEWSTTALSAYMQKYKYSVYIL